MNARTRAAIGGMVLLLSCGCAGREVPPPREVRSPEAPSPPAVSRPPAAQTPRAAPRPPDVPARPEQPTPADNNYRDGLAMLEEGKTERALELFAAAWKEDPGHPGVEVNVPVALERIKKNADEALRQGRPEEAGKRYAAALRFLSHPAAREAPLSFSKTDLKEKLDRISSSLMEKGVEQYRQGKIEAAIATWRQILAYEPSHAEAAKSVRTATTQLENLKKLTPETPPK